MHRVGIIHHDIKFGNILYFKEDESFGAQLIDFNLAKFYYPGSYDTGKSGTVGYYSAEELFRSLFVNFDEVGAVNMVWKLYRMKL